MYVNPTFFQQGKNLSISFCSVARTAYFHTTVQSDHFQQGRIQDSFNVPNFLLEQLRTICITQLVAFLLGHLSLLLDLQTPIISFFCSFKEEEYDLKASLGAYVLMFIAFCT